MHLLNDSQPILSQLEKKINSLEKELASLHEQLGKKSKISANYNSLEFDDTEIFKTLSTRLNIKFYIFNKEAKFVYANKSLLKLLEYSEEEFSNLHFFNVIHEEDRAWVRERGLKRLGGNQQPTGYTLRAISKTGKLLWLRIHASPVKISGNDYVVGIADDITEMKEQQNKLSKNIEKYKSLYSFVNMMADHVPDLIWAKDLSGKYIFVNQATCKIFLGIDNAEYPIGKTTQFFIDQQKNTDRLFFSDGSFEKFEQHVTHSLQPSRTVREGVYNGKTMFLDILIAPFYNEDKELIGLVGSARDITREKLLEIEQDKQKHTQEVIYQITNAVLTSVDLSALLKSIEKQLSKVIDTSNLIIALHNKKTDEIDISYFIDQKDDFLTITPQHSITSYLVNSGESLFLKGNEIESFIQSKKLKKYGSMAKCWLGIPLKYRENVFGAVVLQSYESEEAFQAKDLELLEFVGKTISIAIHRKIMEENLVEARNRAQQSDKLKTVFLSNISHEIRTPMNAILGFSELLKDQDLSNEESLEYIGYLEKNSQILLSIIKDIIDLSKIESGDIQIIYNQLNINQFLNDFYNKNIGRIQHGQQLINDAKKDTQTFLINTDPMRLYQMMSSMLDLSINLAASGQIHMGFEMTDNKIRFYVKDTGRPLNESQIRRLFSIFGKHGDKNIVSQKEKGLGMAFSKRLAEVMGGDLWHESNEQYNNIFYLSLPAKPQKTNTNELQQNIKKNSVKSLADCSVLIAEDINSNYEFLHALLVKENVKNIIHARNGNEVIDLLKKGSSIDIILLDLKMPEKDGFQTLVEIREFLPELPVLVVSANVMEDEKEKCFTLGCTDYIEKPIDMKMLIKSMNLSLSK